ncbi:hypothetical protein K470DRAFT_296029 [Piedraia hortae CBS 480.64]|uniref:Uncharacterized protein n=1 Tax=Piedraia hortae CBS 480.64 TaxID=1314780 RepID=A0A6A7BUJ9_9PEZI|nr:hypothetical protein K470DRAFT_296029 [Piedraia hortae CBS 480.64]
MDQQLTALKQASRAESSVTQPFTEEITRLKQELAQTQQVQQTTPRKLSELRSKQQDITEENARLQQQLAEAQKPASTAPKAVEAQKSTSTELEKLRTEEQELVEENARLQQQQKAEAQQAQQSTSTEVSALRAQQQELARENARLQQYQLEESLSPPSSVSRSQLQKLTEQNNRLQQQLEDCRQDAIMELSALQTKQEDLLVQNTKLQEQKVASKKTASEKSSAQQTKQQQLTDEITRLQQHRSEIQQTAQRELNNLKSQQQDMTDANTRLRQSASSNLQRVECITAPRKTYPSARDADPASPSLGTECAEWASPNTQRSRRVGRKTTKLKTASEQMQTATNKVQRLTALHEEERRRAETLEVKETDSHTLRKVIQAQFDEIRYIPSRLAGAESEQINTRIERERLKLEKEALEKKVDEMQNSLEEQTAKAKARQIVSKGAQTSPVEFHDPDEVARLNSKVVELNNCVSAQIREINTREAENGVGFIPEELAVLKAESEEVAKAMRTQLKASDAAYAKLMVQKEKVEKSLRQRLQRLKESKKLKESKRMLNEVLIREQQRGGDVGRPADSI